MNANFPRDSKKEGIARRSIFVIANGRMRDRLDLRTEAFQGLPAGISLGIVIEICDQKDAGVIGHGL